MRKNDLTMEIIELMHELEEIRGETIDFDSILSQLLSSSETVS